MGERKNKGTGRGMFRKNVIKRRYVVLCRDVEGNDICKAVEAETESVAADMMPKDLEVIHILEEGAE